MCLEQQIKAISTKEVFDVDKSYQNYSVMLLTHYDSRVY